MGERNDLSEVINIFKDAASMSDDVYQQKRENKANEIAHTSLGKFPKEMSCVTAMDELFQCFSLGGQIRNFYQYGDFTMCERQSSKLRFCLTITGKSSDERERMIQRFYRDRLVDDKRRGSSEDVWDQR
ncbi:Early meiotic induction protein [Komagataella phaffii CBS 7435]|uniref:Early meiotic induction protein 1 n=2 Tax=Komagataella phaffii TaxID=460519 RepID=C4R964_KOMPG|nr:Non-essential protein of unknown function [Komagataella phaffii GS115]AOA65092.1 GQ67_05264T0 [Komagataella phaffii]CAH2450451.1 Early meiotic induction protein [Komagataella phaffii CBS 7435]AOA69772.1 GQ68_05246T0 [Komagataella phaffii GS115]CAY72139.1 Non-essential protein of unknown function [Komagataella phaffii GS115]CCA40258.1 Early meiotic induction protein [Komagataella phaffii CBS 7435]